MNETPSQYSEALVTCDWLETHLNDPDLVIFDCTTYLVPHEGPNRPYDIQSGKADYDEGHIPGAGYFDLQKDFSVADSPYRFTLPSAQETAATFARHGVSDGKRVVLYSRKNLQWATRFWWMLRWLGFNNVSILDGGYDKWVADGRMTSTNQCKYQAGQLSINLRPELFVGKEAVKSAIGAPETCTINALAIRAMVVLAAFQAALMSQRQHCSTPRQWRCCRKIRSLRPSLLSEPIQPSASSSIVVGVLRQL